MTVDEIKALKEKISNDSATPEERLTLLRSLNANIEGMRQDIGILKSNKELEDVRNELKEL